MHLQGCYEAFKRRLNASHAVSCVPGTQAVSDKGGLAASLRAAYGPAAWGIVPRSFRLPGEYAELAAHIKQVRPGARGPGGRAGAQGARARARLTSKRDVHACMPAAALQSRAACTPSSAALCCAPHAGRPPAQRAWHGARS